MAEDREPGQPCRPCEILWGTIGVLAGIALLYMGFDLLLGGGVTRRISGRRSSWPDAVSLPEEEEWPDLQT